VGQWEKTVVECSAQLAQLAVEHEAAVQLDTAAAADDDDADAADGVPDGGDNGGGGRRLDDRAGGIVNGGGVAAPVSAAATASDVVPASQPSHPPPRQRRDGHERPVDEGEGDVADFGRARGASADANGDTATTAIERGSNRSDAGGVNATGDILPAVDGAASDAAADGDVASSATQTRATAPTDDATTRSDEAKRAARRLSVAKRAYAAYTDRATAHANLGAWRAVIHDCTRALAHDARDARALAARGNAHGMLSLWRDAVRDCTAAIDALAPRAVLAQAAYCNRAVALRMLGEPVACIRDCTRAIVLDPANAAELSNRSLAYVRTARCSRVAPAGSSLPLGGARGPIRTRHTPLVDVPHATM